MLEVLNPQSTQKCKLKMRYNFIHSFNSYLNTDHKPGFFFYGSGSQSVFPGLATLVSFGNLIEI